MVLFCSSSSSSLVESALIFASVVSTSETCLLASSNRETSLSTRSMTWVDAWTFCSVRLVSSLRTLALVAVPSFFAIMCFYLRPLKAFLLREKAFRIVQNLFKTLFLAR